MRSIALALLLFVMLAAILFALLVFATGPAADIAPAPPPTPLEAHR